MYTEEIYIKKKKKSHGFCVARGGKETRDQGARYCALNPRARREM